MVRRKRHEQVRSENLPPSRWQSRVLNRKPARDVPRKPLFARVVAEAVGHARGGPELQVSHNHPGSILRIVREGEPEQNVVVRSVSLPRLGWVNHGKYSSLPRPKSSVEYTPRLAYGDRQGERGGKRQAA